MDGPRFDGRFAVAAAIAIVLAGIHPVSSQAIANPADDGRATIDLVRGHGVDVGIVGVVRTTADGERLFAWFREIEQLQRGRYIPQIQRFSAPPQMLDLAQLVLDESELQELRTCRAGDCEMKLADAEIGRVTAAITSAGGLWRDAAQRAFREVLLARARAFLEKGLGGTPAYNDRAAPVAAAEDFERLLGGCRLDGLRADNVVHYLRRFPSVPDPRVETFLFWSRDLLGDAKPIVGITAVSLFPEGPAGQPPMVSAVQVYASHYITSSFSVTALVPTADRAGRYLVYRRCTRADVFGGMFGGFIRRAVNRRVRSEGPSLLEWLRRKLEAGPPPRQTR